MKKEDKELLLKDLSARLPYGVIINTGDKDLKLDRKHQCIGVLYSKDCSDEFNERNNNASFYIIISGYYYGEEIKPYLRPMSSMTVEERKEYDSKRKHICDNYNRYCFDTIESIDWLNAHHFDYRNLIEKGLALETLGDMYKID